MIQLNQRCAKSTFSQSSSNEQGTGSCADALQSKQNQQPHEHLIDSRKNSGPIHEEISNALLQFLLRHQINRLFA